MQLSRTERWILSNQFNILAKLDPKEAKTYMERAEIVERGYELNYDWISEHISQDDSIMSPDQCNEVSDILNMYSLMGYAYETLEDKSGINPSDIKFKGFDGNYETTYMAYARFLVEQQGAFENLSTKSNDTLGDYFNSHSPSLSGYRKMLVEWKNTSDISQLRKSDIIRIISAK